MKKIILLLVVSFSFFITTYSQQTAVSEFEYISPVPRSGMNMPETNIIIRYGPTFNSNDVYSQNLIEVVGNESGLHSGEIMLTEDNKTLLFNPDVPFQEGEDVSVKFLRSTKTEDDQTVPALSFSFKITENNINEIVKRNPENYLSNEYLELSKINSNNSLSPISENHPYSVMDDSLPEDFPTIEIDSLNDPTPGYIFLTPFSFSSIVSNYLIITDNFGVPVFYRKTSGFDLDFKKQPGEMLTFFDGSKYFFYSLDNSYQVIDSITVGNGYVVDFHELLILGNEHILILGQDYQHIAMDTVVQGGDPNAIVVGEIVQELDENKNVVFQWRSWDHFKITDATYNIDLTDSLVDYVHGNAIEVDYDGNILVSNRHMDEVTKINRQTGNIIWRWGGEYCENNEFTFLNDPIGFSHQHYVRKLPNGNITLFDNGNLHSPPFSRVAEYQLDEVNKFAALVWEYRNDPGTFSYAMGSASRLDNHNTIIGWGSETLPAISEVTANGEVALFLSLPDTIYNYRAFKFPWKTNLFVGNPDSLYFGYVPLGDSLQLQLEITNNSVQQVEINSIYSRYSAYSVIDSLPITLAPLVTASITIKFKPLADEIRDFKDELHLRWDTEGQRIAQVIPLIGSTDPNFTSVEDEDRISDYFLSQNYPNPFNPTTTIKYQIPEISYVNLKVYDILGNEVATLVNEEKPAGSYEVQFNSHPGEGWNLTSGIYFYKLNAGQFSETKKMILLK